MSNKNFACRNLYLFLLKVGLRLPQVGCNFGIILLTYFWFLKFRLDFSRTSPWTWSIFWPVVDFPSKVLGNLPKILNFVVYFFTFLLVLLGNIEFCVPKLIKFNYFLNYCLSCLSCSHFWLNLVLSF